ncbi:phosphonate C-P lyase system protein PhnH [[Mycobacterium] burgundiense]|uniref:Phosphonate C-P lyase system protein PhnH n=1 Tax=[Mycobacterium] burgundiense TaxID=3064286 RepID=A0ABM9LPL8_9MYCO|nr:phosphonate C-P lyase system protein PhnH [Mycolicibacterium sp. MU0053]CAJ1502597.1 phosphonate C-P lyase system protein PhnH [Mycolicibacterium sp. MU0053]
MTWDRVHDGRTAFLACMRALCAPGEPMPLPALAAMSDVDELNGAAAVLLALLDPGLVLGVAGGPAAQRVAARVAAETGAELGAIGVADWVLVHGPAADAIERARRGDRSNPERGATVVIAATAPPVAVRVSGPGVDGTATAAVPLEAAALRAFGTANAESPCGVDLFLTAGEQLLGLPRSLSMQRVVP